MLPFSRIVVLLIVVTSLLFSGCYGQKSASRKEDSAPVPVIEPDKPWICNKIIDGLANDWTNDEPLWEEAGLTVIDPGFHVDVKQVYVTNDILNLYMFVRCTPTIDERFKQQALEGKIADILWDIDNDPTTGSTETELDIFGYGNGYETKMTLNIGIYPVSEKKQAAYVSYDVYYVDREGLDLALQKLAETFGEGNIVVWRFVIRRAFLWKKQDSLRAESQQVPASIAYGPDGVEFKIPLSALRLSRFTCVRILFGEEAHDYEMEGYSVRYYTVQ
jgi:hypothetical protein